MPTFVMKQKWHDFFAYICVTANEGVKNKINDSL